MKIIRAMFGFVVIVFLMVELAASGRAQSGDTVTVTGFWPLYDFVRRLETQYAKPVTFETAPLLWRGHMQRLGILPDGTEDLMSVRHGFATPRHGVLDAPALTAAVVERVVDAYQQSNPGFPRYRVAESQMGLHITPTDAPDEAGVLRPVESVLDRRVTVLVEKRTASEHLGALLKAVSSSTGISTVSQDNPDTTDSLYAANGYLLRLGVPADVARQYKLFEWGASEMSARDALIDLLRGSATTMSWSLRCWPDSRRNEQQTCHLALETLWVGPQRRQVTFDRCTKCRPIPVQAR